MAYVSDDECRVCERVTQHVNRECVECRARKYRQATAAWNALTVEERLQDLRRRVEALEARPLTY
jgi:acyl-CoA reductase-like NAD-dependent aldehyde dehydrogenase